MKSKRFSVEQVVAVLKQPEVRVPVAELIRQVGISEQTLYRWKKQCKGLATDQVVNRSHVRTLRLWAGVLIPLFRSRRTVMIENLDLRQQLVGLARWAVEGVALLVIDELRRSNRLPPP